MSAPWELIRSPWSNRFAELVSAAQEDLVIVSPFISRSGVETLRAALRSRDRASVRLSVLTRIDAGSMITGALDVAALAELRATTAGACIAHVPRLHAKLYVADEAVAVVTSANLTEGGLNSNLEYGVLLREVSQIRQLRRHIDYYAQFGIALTAADLTGFAELERELRRLYGETQRTIARQARVRLAQMEERLADRVLEARSRGQTTQGLLRAAITHVLATHGPLATEELHPLVQALLPDLCDDAIDRVIGGVHFGKRWKHRVRSAQQAMKRAGEIARDGDRWTWRESPR